MLIFLEIWKIHRSPRVFVGPGGWKDGGDSPDRWLLVGPLAGELR